MSSTIPQAEGTAPPPSSAATAAASQREMSDSSCSEMFNIFSFKAVPTATIGNAPTLPWLGRVDISPSPINVPEHDTPSIHSGMNHSHSQDGSSPQSFLTDGLYSSSHQQSVVSAANNKRQFDVYLQPFTPGNYSRSPFTGPIYGLDEQQLVSVPTATATTASTASENQQVLAPIPVRRFEEGSAYPYPFLLSTAMLGNGMSGTIATANSTSTREASSPTLPEKMSYGEGVGGGAFIPYVHTQTNFPGLPLPTVRSSTSTTSTTPERPTYTPFQIGPGSSNTSPVLGGSVGHGPFLFTHSGSGGMSGTPTDMSSPSPGPVNTDSYPGYVPMICSAGAQRALDIILPDATNPQRDLILRDCEMYCSIICRNQFGCCAFQQCIERAPPMWRERLVLAAVQNSLELIQDRFGNYVLQYALDVQGLSFAVPRAVAEAIAGHEVHLCMQKYASNVMEKIIKTSSRRVRARLVEQILVPETLLDLIQDRYSNYVIQVILVNGTNKERSKVAQVANANARLRQTPYCRQIFNMCHKYCPLIMGDPPGGFLQAAAASQFPHIRQEWTQRRSQDRVQFK